MAVLFFLFSFSYDEWMIFYGALCDRFRSLLGSTTRPNKIQLPAVRIHFGRKIQMK